MHRDIWEHYKCKIPKGYHIHHIDGNKLNNEIENLEIKKAKEHLAEHMTLERKQFAREVINKIARPKAIIWHKSKEGLAWHKKHFEDSLRKSIDTKINKFCQVCGQEYQVNLGCANKSKFCSNNCKIKFRKKLGLDNIEKSCIVCASHFTTNKYSKVKTCSRKCGGKLLVFRRNGIHWLK